MGDHHQRFKHPVGMNLAIAKLERKFIILGINREMQKITNRCITCKRQRPTVGQPMMGPLPTDLTSPRQRAFAVVGLDFAGPFTLKGAGKGAEGSNPTCVGSHLSPDQGSPL